MPRPEPPNLDRVKEGRVSRKSATRDQAPRPGQASETIPYETFTSRVQEIAGDWRDVKPWYPEWTPGEWADALLEALSRNR